MQIINLADWIAIVAITLIYAVAGHLDSTVKADSAPKHCEEIKPRIAVTPASGALVTRYGTEIKT